MLRVEHITSFEDPALEPYQTMKRTVEHQLRGIFVAEGEKVVRRLLESNFTVVSLLLPEKWLHNLEPLLASRAEEIRVFVAPKEQLETLTGYSMYQGLLAVGRIPPPMTLETMVARSIRPRLFIAVDGLANAENLGVVVRNCVAFGVQALLVGETSSSPFLRRAVRSSMGTVFKLPVIEVSNLAAALRELRTGSIRSVAAHPHADGRTLVQAALADDCCLVLGSEGQGIAPTVLAACDDLVAIPMASGVDSLNVGSAAAVFLYEAARQRGRMGRVPVLPA